MDRRSIYYTGGGAAGLPGEIPMGRMESLDTGAEESTKEYLSFRLGDEEYGIDIAAVREIRAYEKPMRIPNSPDYYCGVINLRGQIMPIIDLRIQLGLAGATYDALTVVIILKVAGRPFGIVVDGVSDVVALTSRDIRPAPEFGTQIGAGAILGLATVQERMLILMDIERLLTSRGVSVEAYAEAA